MTADKCFNSVVAVVGVVIAIGGGGGTSDGVDSGVRLFGKEGG